MAAPVRLLTAQLLLQIGVLLWGLDHWMDRKGLKRRIGKRLWNQVCAGDRWIDAHVIDDT